MAAKRQTDADLVRACQRGDEAAWEELIRRHRRLVYSIPHAYRLRADAADEIFQRVAVKLLEHLSALRDPEKLVSWLAMTTRRECWAYQREGRRWEELSDEQAERLPEEPPDVVEALDQVSAEHVLSLAFEQLDDPCRTLLHALYVEEPRPSYEELSERLGRPIGSLGPTRGRCLGKLKRLFEKQGGTEPVLDGA